MFDIHIAGADHPHVGAELLDASDAAELLFLEHSEELGLKVKVHLRHLVQEDGSSLGSLEKSRLAALLGAGESPFLITEEFAFQEGLADGRAVDCNEGGIPSAAGIVDGL